MNQLTKTALALYCVMPMALFAQVNEAGTVHLSIGIAPGAHATEYTTSFSFFGLQQTNTETDAAATLTIPIRVSVGVAKPLSIGVLIEPGTYLDSNATRSNSLLILAVEPRFYMVNTDRFAWTGGFQAGIGTLNIKENSGAIKDAKYSGLNLGINTGIRFYFSDKVGMEFNTRYIATDMKLRSYTENGTGISLANFEAELKTKGITFELGVVLKF